MTQIDQTLVPAAAYGPRYDPLTQAIHWLSLIAIAVAFVIGFLLDGLPRGPAKTQLVNLHASLGVLVIALTALRLGWRAFAATPPSLGPGFMQFAASAMHLVLSAVVLAVPIGGVLMMAAKGRPFDVFGLLSVSPFIATDRAFGQSLEETHELLSYLMLALIGLHSAAAVFHQAILKDGALTRMLPFGRTSKD
jgi:cytochrome b561